MKEFTEIPIKDDVLSKRESVAYTAKVENNDWIRPIHSDTWNDSIYQEKFPDSSLQVEAAPG